MPREYRTTGGPAAPSPSGFGSADINLQTPRFVAQTAVAMPEDPFAALQKILGMATEVGTQAFRYQAAEIEGKITYQKAVEAKQEREDILKRRAEADTDRENARLAAEFSAAAKLEIAKAKTPEEAKTIEERLLKEAREGETTEMKATRAQVIEQAESEARQLQAEIDKTKQEERQAFLDNALAIRAMGDERIQNAFEAADPGALEDIALSYAWRAEQETDPRMKATYTGLRAEAFAKKEALEGKAELDDKRQEAALVTAARETFGEAASTVVTGLRADLMKTAGMFESATDSALEQAVFDTVKEKVLSDERMVGLVAYMSPAEEKAVSEAIRQQSEVLVRDMVSARNDKYRRQAEETKVSAWVAEGSVNFDAAIEAIDNDTTVSDAARRRAYGEVAKARVSAENTDIGKLRAAAGLYGRGNPILDSQSVRMTKEIIGNIGTRVQQERTGLVDLTQQQGDEFSKGWTAKYNTRDEFLTDVLERHFGTDLNSLQDPEVSNLIGPTVNRLVNQREEDTKASGAAQRAAEVEVNAADRARRRGMKIEENWKFTPLARALADGSHSKTKVEDLEPMIVEAMVGYSDTKMPDELKAKVVGAFDDPNNFSLVTAYWNVMNRSMDPTARNNAISDARTMQSWGLGAFLQTLGPEVDGRTTAALGTEMARNLQAKNTTPDKDGPVTKALAEQRSKAVLDLTMGAGLDTGWFDFTGVKAKDVTAKLPPADQALLLNMATIAGSAPRSQDVGATMSHMLRQQGFAIYPVQADNGDTSFQIVQNVRGKQGSTPLPPPAVLESNGWRSYLLSKKQAIADALNALPKLDVPGGGAVETIFRPEHVEDVHIAVYDQDVKQGYVAVRAKVSGEWRSIPVNAVSVSADDFEATRASRAKALEQVFAKSAKDNNPWIPDAYENLFK